MSSFCVTAASCNFLIQVLDSALSIHNITKFHGIREDAHLQLRNWILRQFDEISNNWKEHESNRECGQVQEIEMLGN